MADVLHFEATTHTYKLLPRGIELPSVSRIIQPLVDFSKVPRQTLEYAIEYLGPDELLEVTPKSLRIRKRIADAKLRMRAQRQAGG